MEIFCCNAFRFHYSLEKEMGLNIRIIKLTAPFVEDGISPFKFLITNGYTQLNDEVNISFINYCPYCGEQLDKIYGRDEFVNETHHEY